MSIVVTGSKKRSLNDQLDYREEAIGGGTARVGAGMTCTRAGTATYRAPSYEGGTAASANTIRREIYGTLIEPSATNIALYSNDLDNGVWTTVGSSVTENPGGAPNGTDSSWIVECTTPGIYGIQQASLGATKSCFCYCKKNTNSTLMAVSNDPTLTASTNHTMRDEWIIASHEDDTRASSSLAYVSVGSLGDKFEIAFCQAEDTKYKTTYIPTTSGTVTRNFDKLEDTAFTSAAPNGDYAYAITWTRANAPTEGAETLVYVDGETYRALQVVHGTGPYTYTARAWHGSTPKLATSTTTIDLLKPYRLAVRYDSTADELTMWVNGVKEASTDVAGNTVTGTATGIHIGYGVNTSTGPCTGWAKNFKYIEGYAPTDYEMKYL